jgi:peptidoglycan hydrolase CwlO-like protein
MCGACDKEDEMNFWEKIKSDMQKGVEEGITFVKEGAAVVQKKAGELTEEGKKRYRLFELRSKVQKEISDLGGRVYDLSSKVKNPMLDVRVKAIKARIEKLQVEIMNLEGKAVPKTRKTSPKKRAVKKSKEIRTA